MNQQYGYVSFHQIIFAFKNVQSFHLNSFVLHMEQDCFLHDVCVVHSVKCKLDFSGCMHVCVVGQMGFRSK